jgi:predicted secreted hydrolase
MGAPAASTAGRLRRHPRAASNGGGITGAPKPWGFQITFFRAATAVAGAQASRFAARQVLFAHGAVTDLAARRLRHDQRIARSGFAIAEASERDTALVLGSWRLARSDVAGRSRYRRMRRR